MFRYLFFLSLTACPQAMQFDVFDDEFSDSWFYKCNDHEEDSQVLVILDHCGDNQLFIRSEVQMHDHEKYWGALVNVRECHWEAVVKLDRENMEHQCGDVDFVEVERLRTDWGNDSGDTGF
jgi:hypothetical protein|tara:strand:+ start:339 stop:701 length:363 start_codon:yes stop_codon:yes gene_type:complete